MKKKLDIKIMDLEQASKEFINAWHFAEQSTKKIIPKEILTFDSLQLLLKILTPRRLELLQTLHNIGITSILNLSKILKKDYHNVHSDVKLLEQCGLIEKKTDKIHVPWSDIVASLSWDINYKIGKKYIEPKHKKAS